MSDAAEFDPNDLTQVIIRLVQEAMLRDARDGVTVEGYNALYDEVEKLSTYRIAELEAENQRSQNWINEAVASCAKKNCSGRERIIAELEADNDTLRMQMHEMETGAKAQSDLETEIAALRQQVQRIEEWADLSEQGIRKMGPVDGVEGGLEIVDIIRRVLRGDTSAIDAAHEAADEG